MGQERPVLGQSCTGDVLVNEAAKETLLSPADKAKKLAEKAADDVKKIGEKAKDAIDNFFGRDRQLEGDKTNLVGSLALGRGVWKRVVVFGDTSLLDIKKLIIDWLLPASGNMRKFDLLVSFPK